MFGPTYTPIIEEGTIVNLGSAGDATTTRFHLHAKLTNNRRLRSLNDRDQLLFTISSEEHRDALVVADLKTATAPTISVTSQGTSLEWDGNGTLEMQLNSRIDSPHQKRASRN